MDASLNLGDSGLRLVPGNDGAGWEKI